MWIRFLTLLRCPVCHGSLDCRPFNETSVDLPAPSLREAERFGILNDDFNKSVDDGVLLCEGCRGMFPIFRGLPVLLPYTTELHRHFEREFRGDLARTQQEHRFPDREPVDGEDFVRKSFSQEWADYRYDGVLWELSYEDDEQRFLQETGSRWARPGGTFLEVGCGLGRTTYLARKHFQLDAVGVDLSSAVAKAAQHFKSDPFLHFAQASAFYLPFEPASFDAIYSRGVLHHTYSTGEAFKAVARHCRVGGSAYLWVYGSGSIDDTLFRRGAHALERVFRPLLSRNAASLPSRSLLGALALGYIGYNAARRRLNPQVQQLTFSRAMHAARDRFTPRFAHRHPPEQVVEWFRDCGFDEVELLDWRTIPSADREDFRRNVGVRGRRKPVHAARLRLDEMPNAALTAGSIHRSDT